MVPICPLGHHSQSSDQEEIEVINKRLLSRLMLERVKGLRSSTSYFFRGDFKDVLTGVNFEYVPRGLYLWNFRFPLFDFAGPHLSYSDRLHERSGFIGKNEMSEEAIIDFVLSSPEARSAFDSEPMGISEFAQFLEAAPGFLRYPHGRFIHAAALVLLGQESRAADLLDELVPALHPTDIANCNLLRTKLQQGPIEARALLEQVRVKNLRVLGLAV
jgi:hypothetical protein